MRFATRFRYVFLVYLAFTGCVFAAMTAVAHPWTNGGPSIFGQTFLVGDTARSLVEHGRLDVCTEAMGTPGNPICYRAARMPVASGVLALGAILFGDTQPARITFAKNLLFLVPFWAAAGLVLWQARSRPTLLLQSAALLLTPAVIMVYSGTVVNVDAEEGYLFGLLGLGLTLLLFRGRHTVAWVLAVAATLDLLFLCKSSMLGVFAVLGCGALLTMRTRWKQVLLVLLLCAAPIGWGVRQKLVSGHFSVGTSLDGINLEKGNNERFLSRYPSVSGALDQFDSELNSGMHFQNEWQFNQYHSQRAKQFIQSHPGYAAHSAAVKVWQSLFTFDRHSRSHYGRALTAVVEGGFILFRLLLWASILYAIVASVTGSGAGRFTGVIYLLFLAAYLAPYIAGFGYTRHIVMPLFPAVLLLSSALVRGGPGSAATTA